MIPTYPYSLSSFNSNSNSTMPIIDLNIVDDHQSHELIFSPTHQPCSSSSSSLSSSSCPILFNPSHQLQDHPGSSHWESKNLRNDHDEACGKNIIASSGGSWNDPDQEKGGGGVEIRKRGLKLKVWKRSSAASGLSEKEDDEENNHNHNHNQTEDNYDSVKWMPSKMRMMRKMIVASSDRNHNNKASSSSSSEDQNQNQYQNQQRLLLVSSRGNDNSSSSNNSSAQSNNNNNNNNITVRVCADCHTTKTPLWRSGPRGPKSLCNACGIRQRKARRAMVAAAHNSGSPDLKAAEKSVVKGTYKVHSSKEKKLKFERETHHHQIMKKKQKVEDDDDHQDKEANNNNSNERSSSSSSSIINKFGSFEDFTVSLMGKNMAAASQVFPQDEKEAAILLMALSCNGLVHG